MTDVDDPPRTALIAALVIAIVAVGAVLTVVAFHRVPRQPVPIPTVAAPDAADPVCAALLDVLPRKLGDYARAAVAQPAPEGAAAWTAGNGEPIVLRCGLERPNEFVVGSPIQTVDAVQWFQLTDQGRATWYTVDRSVYIALTLPPRSGPAPIQQLSALIDATVPAVSIDPVSVG